MKHRFLIYALTLSLAGCSSLPPSSRTTTDHVINRQLDPKAEEAVLYSLGLLDTGYRFGGRNPEAGLDCSGMVIYIYNQVASMNLSGSAADLAKRGHAVDKRDLLPGDLVFFNTSGRSFSHVGLYIGDNRFIHAPSTNGKVRIERLDSSYFSSRFEVARTLFD